MREDPGVDAGAIAAAVEVQYGLGVVLVRFLPIGYDMNAAVYEVVVGDGASYFLKVRFGPVQETGLLVPRMLLEHGIGNVLAPVRTRSGGLWCSLDGYPGYTVVLFPFVRGENAMVVGLSNEQWREFGAALRAVHDSGLGERLRNRLPGETFALPSAGLVRQLLALPESEQVKGAVAARFGAFWREYAERIERMLNRAEALGRELQAKSFELVLCHADIHAANILVGEDGRIWLVDWDGPLIAPRERDLLFVVGSTIARPVEPREEGLFFEGYGAIEVDPAALIYYRYERAVEDIGEVGKRVLLDPNVGEEARGAEAELAMNYFAPGGYVDRVETVGRSRWPGESSLDSSRPSC